MAEAFGTPSPGDPPPPVNETFNFKRSRNQQKAHKIYVKIIKRYKKKKTSETETDRFKHNNIVDTQTGFWSQQIYEIGGFLRCSTIAVKANHLKALGKIF